MFSPAPTYLPSGSVELRVRNDRPGISATVRTSAARPWFIATEVPNYTGLVRVHGIGVREHWGTLAAACRENEQTEFAIWLLLPNAWLSDVAWVHAAVALSRQHCLRLLSVAPC